MKRHLLKHISVEVIEIIKTMIEECSNSLHNLLKLLIITRAKMTLLCALLNAVVSRLSSLTDTQSMHSILHIHRIITAKVLLYYTALVLP